MISKNNNKQQQGVILRDTVVVLFIVALSPVSILLCHDFTLNDITLHDPDKPNLAVDSRTLRDPRK